MNKLIRGDCLSFLKSLPDKSIDLLCTDPPYGLGIAKSGKFWDSRFTPKKWDTQIPSKEYFDEMIRVSKHQIIWGGNHFTHFLPASRCWLVWWKNDGLTCANFADCELAWTSFAKPARVFNSRWRGFVRDSREPRVAHPTQKALMVMQWCIRDFSVPGDIILDPFAGSGTTLVAAKSFGRKYIGVEREKEYIDIARSRLKSTIRVAPEMMIARH